MSGDEDDQEYYDEKSEEDLSDRDWRTEKHNINVYAFHGLPRPTGYDRTVWTARGTFAGDIKWNASNLQIDWALHQSTAVYYLSVKLEPFTKNCGIKAISYLSNNAFLSDDLVKTFIKYVENFAYNCCNTGILVGSDSAEREYQGTTGRLIRTCGVDYVFTDMIWNPNYTWEPAHNVFLFHKNLAKAGSTYEDFWKP